VRPEDTVWIITILLGSDKCHESALGYITSDIICATYIIPIFFTQHNSVQDLYKLCSPCSKASFKVYPTLHALSPSTDQNPIPLLFAHHLMVWSWWLFS